MLSLRMTVDRDIADTITQALTDTGGVSHLVELPAVSSGEKVVVLADVAPAVADRVLMMISKQFQISPDDYIITREDVVAPSDTGRSTFGPEGTVAWIEVMDIARENSRPLARYIALIVVAAILAALGVITSNGILIVGAMAVSPDLLPICAACVALVGGHLTLARRAIVTLVIGMVCVAVVSTLLAWILTETGEIASDFVIGEGGLGTLATTDYTTVLIALAAGVGAMLSFETRASAAVGVAISVTTIPASAYAGVAFGVGEASEAWGAVLVLAINVVLLVLSGTATLALQRRLAARA